MVSFTVNGKPRQVDTPADRPLLEVLREDLGLTGSHYGCGEGMCRACTVLIDGKATVSCVLPVAQVEGKTVTTIEGLADGETLHPVQRVFMERNAFQCGYCTSGMIMTLVSLLNEKADVSTIFQRMNANACRCCGYDVIADAIREAAKGGAR